MARAVIRAVKIVTLVIVVVIATVLGVRIVDSLRGPPLELWHTFVPDELTVAEIDAADWAGYLAAEERIFNSVTHNVTRELPARDRVAYDRYFAEAPVYPGRFVQDYNRSYMLEPAGEAKGVAVFLHGLTDAPYSLRHVAELYQRNGFVAVLIRMPGHGTVPAGLTEATWEDWMAATRLAVRAGVAMGRPEVPLHLVGYSNGGALAVLYALDALADGTLVRPDRIVLLSPMVGVTRFARFSGIAGWPAVIPAFVKAAWFSVIPEYNPFKYNSFPVNAGRQSYLLTAALQSAVDQAVRQGWIGDLPPILTFMSAIDFTVSARAVVTALYDRLAENGSELVLFDVNRAALAAILFRKSSTRAADRMVGSPPRKYAVTVVGNVAPGDPATVARSVAAGAAEEVVEPLGVDYPDDMFSLSHIAIPFPPSDGLYGSNPDPADDFGIALGTIAVRGETGALIVGLDSLLRNTSNPFYAFVADRIEQGIQGP
jgi:alpha-beta hydrolase superfamily lysophospholipase